MVCGDWWPGDGMMGRPNDGSAYPSVAAPASFVALALLLWGLVLLALVDLAAGRCALLMGVMGGNGGRRVWTTTRNSSRSEAAEAAAAFCSFGSIGVWISLIDRIGFLLDRGRASFRTLADLRSLTHLPSEAAAAAADNEEPTRGGPGCCCSRRRWHRHALFCVGGMEWMAAGWDHTAHACTRTHTAGVAF